MIVISRPREPGPYSQALLRAGASEAAICLAAHDSSALDLDRMRGLLLTGGADVDPELYGETVRSYEESDRQRPVKNDRPRDDFELKLLRQALSRQLPVLAICRGLQLANVHFGGTLYQDLYADHATQWDHRQPENRSDCTHHIRLTDGPSRLRAILGISVSEKLPVNSFHHQGIKTLGRGLRITARAVEDDFPEAFELDDGDFPFFIAVQWHPEELTASPQHLALFRSFLAAIQ